MNAVAVAAVAAVACVRLGELWLARRNTRALLAAGAVERGSGHYPAIVALHASWLAAIAIFVPGTASVSWPLIGVFLGLQCLRVWVLASLGRFWTTRIITLPGAPLVRRGAYRYVRHPNYLLVAAEIAVLPLAFGAWTIALIFTALNAGVLAWRIRLENEALADRLEGHAHQPLTTLR